MFKMPPVAIAEENMEVEMDGADVDEGALRVDIEEDSVGVDCGCA